MNETIKTILNRRSCRSFDSSRVVAREDIELIVKAGTFAPSAKNNQGWHFCVITNRDKLSQLNNAVYKTLPQQSQELIKSRCETPNFFYNAPVVIVVSCSDKSIMPASDCACALQNMFLAATSLNIGSCWINQLTLNENPEIKKFVNSLNIPQGNKIYGCCALGYGLKEPVQITRAEGTVSFVE